MKELCGSLVLLMFVLLFGCNYSEPIEEFTVKGIYIPVEAEVSESVGSQLDSGENSDTRAGKDLSSATLVIAEDAVHDGEKRGINVIAKGEFENGELVLIGEIAEPTPIRVFIQAREAMDLGEMPLDDHRKAEVDLWFVEMELYSNPVIAPGEQLTLALIDYIPEGPDRLEVFGSANYAVDSQKRFKIFGDLSDLDVDLSMATLDVTSTELNEQGTRVLVEHGSVMLADGKFSLRAQVSVPTIVDISIRTTQGFIPGVQGIVEPNAAITVSPGGHGSTLVATAKSGRHAKLIDSWQSSDEYLKTSIAYEEALERYRAQMVGQVETLDDFVDEEESNVVSDSALDSIGSELGDKTLSMDVQAESTATESSEEPNLESIRKTEGCEHVALGGHVATSSENSDEEDYPDYVALAKKMNDIRNEVLVDVALNSHDPFDSLLAWELGAFASGTDDKFLALPVLDRLVEELDETTVSRRVTPRHKYLQRSFEVDRMDKVLVPGQRAPEFTLPNLEGDDITLYDILRVKELVFVDFWASWCGPCIATFPELKELYSDYKEDGFEIVAISIDQNHEAWAEASRQQEVPWINLGEIVEEGKGPVSQTYGVHSIPRGFLIDAKGCVLQKNSQPSAIGEFLMARYGEETHRD